MPPVAASGFSTFETCCKSFTYNRDNKSPKFPAQLLKKSFLFLIKRDKVGPKLDP